MMNVKLKDSEGNTVIEFNDIQSVEEIPIRMPYYPGAVGYEIVSEDELEERRDQAKFESQLVQRLARLMFAWENRFRAIEGRPPMNENAFKAFVRSL